MLEFPKGRGYLGSFCCFNVLVSFSLLREGDEKERGEENSSPDRRRVDYGRGNSSFRLEAEGELSLLMFLYLFCPSFSFFVLSRAGQFA